MVFVRREGKPDPAAPGSVRRQTALVASVIAERRPVLTEELADSAAEFLAQPLVTAIAAEFRAQSLDFAFPDPAVV